MSQYTRRIAISLAVLLVALACNGHGLIPLDEAITVERIDVTEQLETNQIDILFVIDDSGSMTEEQAALIANFDLFVEGLAGINADFRIAVITTDMIDDNGRFQTAPSLTGVLCDTFPDFGCAPSTGPVLEATNYGFDPDDPESTLDVESLQDDFRCIAAVGTCGTGFEAGLDAIDAALSTDLLETVNAGFRRTEAWLAIIFVTDENDCSFGGNQLDFTGGNDCEWRRNELSQVADYEDFLRNIEGTADGDRVLIAGIIGPDDERRFDRPALPSPSCTGDTGTAFSGYRYSELIEAFDDQGVETNICSPEGFDAALDQINSVIRANLAVKCLRSRPRSCDLAANEGCAPGIDCIDPDANSSNDNPVCADFEVIVEKLADDGETWVAQVQTTPGQAGQYRVEYAASSCPSGIGIEFEPGNEPGAGGEFRVRYPVVIGAADPSVSSNDDNGDPAASQE